MLSLKHIKKVYSLCILLSVLSIIFSTDIYNDSWGVIIGINNYNNIKGLNYAVDDAQDMKNILVEKFDFEDKNIILLTDGEATRENIISALYETAQKADDNDRFIMKIRNIKPGLTLSDQNLFIYGDFSLKKQPLLRKILVNIYLQMEAGPLA